MMKDALIGFANGCPIKYYVDGNVEYDSFQVSNAEKKKYRINITIPDSEVMAVNMLNCVVSRNLSNFCKAVFRSSLIQQNLGGFFDTSLISNEQINQIMLRNLDLPVRELKNVIYLSNYLSPSNKPEVENTGNRRTRKRNTGNTALNDTENPFNKVNVTKKTYKTNAQKKAEKFTEEIYAPSLRQDYKPSNEEIQKVLYDQQILNAQVPLNGYPNTPMNNVPVQNTGQAVPTQNTAGQNFQAFPANNTVQNYQSVPMPNMGMQPMMNMFSQEAYTAQQNNQESPSMQQFYTNPPVGQSQTPMFSYIQQQQPIINQQPVEIQQPVAPVPPAQTPSDIQKKPNQVPMDENTNEFDDTEEDEDYISAVNDDTPISIATGNDDLLDALGD